MPRPRNYKNFPKTGEVSKAFRSKHNPILNPEDPFLYEAEDFFLSFLVKQDLAV